MKREWLLLAGSVCLTLLLALGLIRWLAPGLLGAGVPVDRRVVRLSRAVPPYYENAFRSRDDSDAEADSVLINDPVVGHRHVGLVPENSLGRENWDAPFDLLGFRNRAVPVVADVVAIGDSQTEGLNAAVDTNWPGRLRAYLGRRAPVIYNMSVGGWGGVQYLAMTGPALALRPRAIVVAYYTGNDPVEALHLAYDLDPWRDLRAGDRMPERPPSAWPPRPEDVWTPAFPDGLRLAFTPGARLSANDRAYPATAEGYRILAETARRIAKQAVAAGVVPVFTVLPTKELAYAPRVRRAGLAPPADYTRLVTDEAANVAELARAIQAIPGATYVDAVGALQRAALGRRPVYPTSRDGHPRPLGYDVIARALAVAIRPRLPDPPADGLLIEVQADRGAIVLVRGGGVWRFSGREALRANGWDVDPEALPRRPARDLAHLPFLGYVTEADPARFGPLPTAP